MPLSPPVKLFSPESAPHEITVRQVVTCYLAVKRVERQAGLYSVGAMAAAERYLGLFLEWLGERADAGVGSCRKSDLPSFILSRPAWKSAHTRNDAVRYIVGCFRWATDEPLIERNPYRRPSKPLWGQAQPRPAISEAEYAAIMAQTEIQRCSKSRPSRIAFGRAMRFLWATGCRTCEMRTVLWEQLDSAQGVMVLGHHKTMRTGRPRVLAVTAAVRAILDEIGARHAGPIFLNGNGRPWNRNSFGKRFRQYATLAGVRPQLTAYCLRHGFCVSGLRAGVGERQLADVMGHTSTRYVEWYGRSAASQADYLKSITEQIRGKKE